MPIFEKAHYEALARALNYDRPNPSSTAYAKWCSVVGNVADMLYDDNNKFDYRKFWEFLEVDDDRLPQLNEQEAFDLGKRAAETVAQMNKFCRMKQSTQRANWFSGFRTELVNLIKS